MEIDDDSCVRSTYRMHQFEKHKADGCPDAGFRSADVHQHDLQRTVFSGSKYAACRNEHTDGNRHRISDAAILKLC